MAKVVAVLMLFMAGFQTAHHRWGWVAFDLFWVAGIWTLDRLGCVKEA